MDVLKVKDDELYIKAFGKKADIWYLVKVGKHRWPELVGTKYTNDTIALFLKQCKYVNQKAIRYIL